MRKDELRIGNIVRWIDQKEPNIVPWGEGHWLGIQKNYSFNDCKSVTINKFFNDQFPVWLRILNILLKVKEVHRAQNLYFSITNKELKIKHYDSSARTN